MTYNSLLKPFVLNTSTKLLARRVIELNFKLKFHLTAMFDIVC